MSLKQIRRTGRERGRIVGQASVKVNSDAAEWCYYCEGWQGALTRNIPACRRKLVEAYMMFDEVDMYENTIRALQILTERNDDDF